MLHIGRTTGVVTLPVLSNLGRERARSRLYAGVSPPLLGTASCRPWRSLKLLHKLCIFNSKLWQSILHLGTRNMASQAVPDRERYRYRHPQILTNPTANTPTATAHQAFSITSKHTKNVCLIVHAARLEHAPLSADAHGALISWMWHEDQKSASAMLLATMTA